MLGLLTSVAVVLAVIIVGGSLIIWNIPYVFAYGTLVYNIVWLAGFILALIVLGMVMACILRDDADD